MQRPSHIAAIRRYLTMIIPPIIVDSAGGHCWSGVPTAGRENAK
jgi:hypothetical protein